MRIEALGRLSKTDARVAELGGGIPDGQMIEPVKQHDE
jgi:hypothetical protein